MDERLSGPWCAYCGALFEATGRRLMTVDHVPSKVFLDKPYPQDLRVVYVCFECNNSLSPDEECLACMLECVVTGQTDPSHFERSKIADSFERNQALRARITDSMQMSPTGPQWELEQERAYRVILKLARGHLAYEESPRLDMPALCKFGSLCLMSDAERAEFETGSSELLLPEIGGRAFMRVLSSPSEQDWQVAQRDRYRYAVTADTSGTLVRIVIREYLACTVQWAD